MMWNGMGDWSGWGWLWPLHLIIPLVLLALIVAAGLLLVRYLGGWTDNAGWRERRPTALELLEQRYARGEINRDEFLEKEARYRRIKRPQCRLAGSVAAGSKLACGPMLVQHPVSCPSHVLGISGPLRSKAHISASASPQLRGFTSLSSARRSLLRDLGGGDLHVAKEIFCAHRFGRSRAAGADLRF